MENKNRMPDIRLVKDNLDNHHQLQDAVETIYYRIVRDVFDDQLSLFVYRLAYVARYTHNYDARTKEAKAYLAAQDKLREALGEYDKARADLKAWAIKNRKAV